MSQKVIDNANTKKYIVFYSNWCKYSVGALNLLKEKKLSYKSYQIDKVEGGLEKLLEDFKQNKDKIGFDIKHKTRPIIFKSGRFIGGYDDLVKRLQTQ
jgi:glutaredoxin